MKFFALLAFCSLAVLLESCEAAQPTAVPHLDIKFLKGSFVVGPTTKTSPKCQITYLDPVQPNVIRQAASAVGLDGKRALATPGLFNTFVQVGRTGAFKLGDFELKIIKVGPVVRGAYLFIVLFDGTNFTTEISDLFLFNMKYKHSTKRFIKSFGTGRVNNLARSRRCVLMIPLSFVFDDPAKM